MSADDERYPAIFERKVEFLVQFKDKNVVNEEYRDSGGTLQAISFVKDGRMVMSWPPVEHGQPGFEYGMRKRDIIYALGYELYHNILRLEIDKH